MKKICQLGLEHLGCYLDAIQSNATSIDKILTELESSHFQRDKGRLVDKDDAASMEKKKLRVIFDECKFRKMFQRYY